MNVKNDLLSWRSPFQVTSKTSLLNEKKNILHYYGQLLTIRFWGGGGQLINSATCKGGVRCSASSGEIGQDVGKGSN